MTFAPLPALVASCLLLPAWPAALQEGAEAPYEPTVEPASDEGARAMEAFELAEGFEVELFAAEPMLANPVCLYVGDDGAVYVAETFRHTAGVTDMRDHMDWLDDELALRTVEDRIAMLKRREGENFTPGYEIQHERVRLIRDTDGDGLADTATVFADGFREAPDGIAAGLLAYDGEVYYTCIPSLWRLADRDGDGVAEEREVLSTGYGVHVALLGHDMHGLRVGPDGYLYFSIGDRGFHVESEGETIAHDQTGAVLRCELDGTGLEVIHTGLRNPQELAFDDWGNLFTGDNNSDGGDRARWVEILDGADSGWRFFYQTLERPVSRGPWNAEKLWHPAHEGQAAWIVPPIANFANGPSGLTSYPGTGLSADYDGRFFLVDFRGAASYSGVYDFALEPSGSSWKMGPERKFLWNALPTDIDFGPDGKLYFCDWIHGWNKTGKGRVYRTFDPVTVDSEIVRETAALLSEGLGAKSPQELGALLGHADRRVRQEASFQLARRGNAGHLVLTRAVLSEPSARARAHAVWGIGLAVRRHGLAWSGWATALSDTEPEVRQVALRVVGDLRATEASGLVRDRLEDPDPRVRLRAALALGRLEMREAPGALYAFVERDENDEPNLRHAASWALARCATPDELEWAVDQPNARVRMAGLLAMRHQRIPPVAAFLTDADPLIALEAARAIHDDLTIPEALGALADRVDEPHAFPRDEVSPAAWDAFVRRALSAANQVGTEARARSLTRFALLEDLDAEHRAEAVRYLAHWAEPEPREKVTGVWRPLPARDASFLPEFASMLTFVANPGEDAADPDGAVRRAWVELVLLSEARALEPELVKLVLTPDTPSSVRSDALLALESLEHTGLTVILDAVFAGTDGDLRATALEVLERLDPEAALPRIPALLARGEIRERRAAYRILGEDGSLAAAAMLEDELREDASGAQPTELVLDLIAAAEKAGTPELEALLRARTRYRKDHWLPAQYVDGLFGGDRELGRAIFQEDAALACQRCHATEAGAEDRVGPNLAGIGHRRTRLDLLEAIVDPNLAIVPGFETSVLYFTEEAGGGAVSGRIVEETTESILVQDSNGELIDVHPADVDERRPDLSAMPEGLHAELDRFEMRDLLEYLSSL